eukprot:TRINITY_DN60944_c0_g1_i1.p1 TRINITY_DN60944_c0_g1~~TRINITY_DN60944_c0_g1_i1.p1  ORF type:complete len:586 (+),score=73.59 TRINITY_DN60944_c0_g1_i1:36-1793(+)
MLQPRSQSLPVSEVPKEQDCVQRGFGQPRHHPSLPPHRGDDFTGVIMPEDTFHSGDSEGGAQVISRCNSESASKDLRHLLWMMQKSLGELGQVHSKLRYELDLGCPADIPLSGHNHANGVASDGAKGIDSDHVDLGFNASLHATDKPVTNTISHKISMENAPESIKDLMHCEEDDEDVGEQVQEEVKLTTCERVKAFVGGPKIDVLACCLLAAYVIVLGFKMQYDGLQYGFLIGATGMDKPAEDLWPGGGAAFQAIDYSFTIVFTIEVVLRVTCLGRRFWTSCLNWLDFIVVGASLVEIVFSNSLDVLVVRVLRIGKLGRSFRLLKMSHVTESLTMLVRCLGASVGTLFWSLFVLVAIQCVGGMALMYSVTTFLEDDHRSSDSKIIVFSYCGTYSRTMLTMFELLFANWIVPTRVLVENVSEWFSLALVLYRVLIGFAVLNVVNAVFVQSTMRVAQQDDEYLKEQKRKASESMARKVRHLFYTLDTSGDGLLSWEEFQALLTDPVLLAFMHSVDVEPADLKTLFSLLDSGDGEIDALEFTDGILALKGQAKSIDLHHVMTMCKRLEKKVDIICEPHLFRGSARNS